MCRLFALFLALLVGAATAEHYQAWKMDTEYRYLVRGRTLAALQDASDQYTGILTKAILIVRPKGPERLEAKISEARYARIHTKLPHGWNSEISEKTLDMKQFPISDKVFEIRMKHGVVRELIVDKEVPTWQVNVLKSIVSQLQVDTQGENLIPSKHNQSPEGNRQRGVNAMYKTMEDSVTGKCEVLYDINPLPEIAAQNRPELLPMPELRGSNGEGPVIDIVKTRNYDNCQHRVDYHFGITGSNDWEPGTNDNGRFMSRSSVSRVIVTGNLEMFTIQSSVTTNKVMISPNWHEDQKGMVGSRVNLTLLKMGPVQSSTGSWTAPANPESTGNLVYSYNSPFAGPNEDRRPGASEFGGGSSSEGRDSREERQNRYSKSKPRKENYKEDKNDDDDDDDDSRSANSLESNEGRSYWQPHPTLNQPPSSPLLPFFVGNAGKSIHGSDEVDPIDAAKRLAAEIGSDLQNPDVMIEEQTLEKFTILARLIRTMSTSQIAEVQSELYRTPNEVRPGEQNERNVERSTWNAFRDAVAQAGTGPALKTIKNWIKEKKIRGMEAESVVGVLPKVARTPTQEYMDEFFDMATMPETTEEPYLNSTAIIGFAELLRYSRINEKSAHNRYPVHAYGPFAPKNDPAVFRKYIPYMAEQLTKSMEKKELAKSHVYIRALGNVAHPKILSIFEPYLEGKKSATTFQRFFMLVSLDKLATLKPRLGRAIFWRVYQNTGEAHPLRCASVFLLMLTNPPASMLQRMAEFTNYDSNNHVNSAVKSAIESVSKMTSPDFQELANKARAAAPLLNKEVYDVEYTRNYFVDGSMDEINLAYRKGACYIGSDDTLIPQGLYSSLELVYGNFKMPKIEFGVMTSRAKDFTSWFKQLLKKAPWQSHDDMGNNDDDSSSSKPAQFSPENIAEWLKIEAEDGEKLEALLLMRSMYNNKLMTVDKNSLARVPEMMRKAAEELKKGHEFDMQRTQSYDVSLSFPTESGFPFVYTSKVPTLMKLSGKVAAADEHKTVDAAAEIRMVYSMQVQSRFGFLAPFERQHYLAGVDKNIQLYIPMRATFNYDKKEKRAKLEIIPIERNDKYKIFHYSTVPFTSRRNVLSMTPVGKDKETHILMDKEKIHRSSGTLGSVTEDGMSLEIQDEREQLRYNLRDEESAKGWVSMFFPFAITTNIRYTRIELHLAVPNPATKRSIVLSGSFENKGYDSASTKYNKERSRKLNPQAPRVMNNKNPEDPERGRQLLEEARKDIAAADGHIVNFGVELTGRTPIKWFTTLAYADSKIDEKSRALFYSRVMDANTGLEYESCAALESTSSPVASDLQDYLQEMNDYSNALETRQDSPVMREFEMNVRFGENCENGENIRVRGKQEQSERYYNYIKAMPIFAECVKEMKKSDGGGGDWMPSCQNLRVKANALDEAKLTVEYDTQQRLSRTDVSGVIKGLIETFYHKRFSSRPNYAPKTEKGMVEISVDLKRNEGNAKIVVETPDEIIVNNDIDASQLAFLGMNADPDLPMDERLMRENLKDAGSHHHHCILDSEWATSFDGSTYPMNLGKCWHVAMTTFPRNSKDGAQKSDKIDRDMRVSILVRDEENGKKKNVKFTLGNQEVEFTSYGGSKAAGAASPAEVTVDGKRIDLDQTPTSYSYKNGQKTVFEILKRSDNSIRLYSPKYDIDVTYDGRVRIKASDKYRNDVRGLCGNYDGEESNDLTSPQGCIESNPAQFAASYALSSSSDCQGPSMELSGRRNERADVCHRNKIRPGNVVNDQEAGRREKNNDWGYHVKKNRGGDNDDDDNDSGNNNDDNNGKDDNGENKRCTAMRTYVKEDDEVTCFSLRPIPRCASGCEAKNSKWKEVQLYCMKTGEASKRMADRINRGANPDLSQKETSKTTSIKVPMGCRSGGR